MDQLKELLKGKFDEDLLNKLSEQLGEKVENIRPAIDSIIKQVTDLVKGKMGEGGNFLESFNKYLDKDGDGDVDLNDAMAIFNSIKNEGGSKISNVVEDLLGDKKQSMSASISAENGISQDSASKLIEQVTAMVTEGIRKLKQGGGFDLDGILDMVSNNNNGNNQGGSGNILQMLIDFIRKLLGGTKTQ